MSPLLFLAIAVVVPLLGLMVLGVCARIGRQRVSDDDTERFRRRLESIAPPQARDASAAARRRRPSRRRRRRALRGDPTESVAPGSAQRSAAQVPRSIRLVERDYSVLPAADIGELPDPVRRQPPSPAVSRTLAAQSADERFNRPTTARPPAAARRHDRLTFRDQRRRPGS